MDEYRRKIKMINTEDVIAGENEIKLERGRLKDDRERQLMKYA